MDLFPYELFQNLSSLRLDKLKTLYVSVGCTVSCRLKKDYVEALKPYALKYQLEYGDYLKYKTIYYKSEDVPLRYRTDDMAIYYITQRNDNSVLSWNVNIPFNILLNILMKIKIPSIIGWVNISHYTLDEQRQLVKLCMKTSSSILRTAALEIILEQDPIPLQYVPRHKQTREMCIHSVRNNGFQLQYSSYKDDEIEELAIQNNYYAIQWVRKQTYKLCCMAIDIDAWAIEFIINPIPKLRRRALRKDWSCYVLLGELSDREKRMIERRQHLTTEHSEPEIIIID